MRKLHYGYISKLLKANELHDGLPVSLVGSDLSRLRAGGMLALSELKDGAFYIGACRNTNYALWNHKLKVFIYTRDTNGLTVAEDIPYPDWGEANDVFIPVAEITAAIDYSALRENLEPHINGYAKELNVTSTDTMFSEPKQYAFNKSEFYAELEQYKKENPELRAGQACFNLMYKNFPEAANHLRATYIDPFHNNSNILVFIQECEKLINKPKEL